jgi:son of sevenless-like protein
MDLLLERYNIIPPPGLNAGEMMEWTKQKQTPIRLRYVFMLWSVVELIRRVVNTLRNWLDVHYLEDQDASMLDRVDRFTEALHAEGSVTMATQLSNLVIRRVSLSCLVCQACADHQRTSGGDGPRRTVSGGLLSPPAPLIPRVPNGRSIRLLDISPVELARQFTIIESLHFQRIRAIECLNKAWAKEEGPKSAPNVRWVILTANRMAGWVALQILSSKDVKVRASTMKYFVQTAIVGQVSFRV